MWHNVIGNDDCLDCLVCGAHFCDADAAEASDCSMDTQQIHGDVHESGHALDCEACANGGACEHVRQCDCALCA